MAVHFDFIMEDIDAENMMRAIHNDACRISELIMDFMIREDITEEYRANAIKTLRANQEDGFNLIKLMKNTRVPE